MKDLDVLLEKHGLPTWGSEEVKKERAQRNNLLAWDKPKKAAEAVAKHMVADPEFKKAVTKEVEEDPKLAAALAALKPANQLGRPKKTK